MIKLKNYWEETSPSIKKLILWAKGIIGMVSVSAFIQGDPKFSFWFLIGGGVIDGLLQLLPPDAAVKSLPKTVCLLIGLSVATATLTGCFAKHSVVEHSLTDTTTVNYKPVDFNYHGAKVVTGLNLDSLYHAALTAKLMAQDDSLTNLKIELQYKKDSIAALKAGQAIPPAPVFITPKADTSYVTDPQSKAQLSYWMDQYGKLQVGCQSKDQTLQLMVAEVNRLRTQVDKNTTTVTVPVIPKWIWYVLGISVLVNFIFIGSGVFKASLKAV
jgi:hypothetical protein